jgi:ectoine hydroxylase-related dioxygenase (phytanoyl-CoA dioxygenase family)
MTQQQIPEWSEALRRDGIVVLEQVLDRAWVEQVADEFEGIYARARREGRAVDRGPSRWYVPWAFEHMAGLIDALEQPALIGLIEQVLPAPQFTELGVDVAEPGSEYQPLHRDFHLIPGEELDMLSVGFPLVDVTPDMGPFEQVPGTHRLYYDDRVPPADLIGELEQRVVAYCLNRGDVVVRTGAAVHRGTRNSSTVARPQVSLGVVTASLPTPEVSMEVSRGFYDGLPRPWQRRLRATLVDQVTAPQGHVIPELASRRA